MILNVTTVLIMNKPQETKFSEYVLYFDNNSKINITRSQYLKIKPFFKVSEVVKNELDSNGYQSVYWVLLSEPIKPIKFNYYSKAFLL